LHDILLDRLQVAGRRPGVLVQLRGTGMLAPSLTLAAARGSDPDPGGLNYENLALDAQNVVVRVGISPGPIDLALVAERRSTRWLSGTKTIEHLWVGGADLRLDKAFERSGLRVWAESLAGSSWYASDETDGLVRFATARAVVAWRRGGLSEGEGYIEPFAMGGVLDPDMDIQSDLIYEAFFGLNVGYWGNTRLTLQGEIIGSQRNTAPGLFWRKIEAINGNTPFPHVINNQKTVVLQVGGTF
jgi:hypothetical protein